MPVGSVLLSPVAEGLKDALECQDRPLKTTQGSVGQSPWDLELCG